MNIKEIQVVDNKKIKKIQNNQTEIQLVIRIRF